MANMYNLVDYSSVYKDEYGSWVVNDQYTRDEGVYIDPESSDKEILQFLKRIGWLSTDDMRRVTVEDYGDIIEVVARKGGMPLGGLYPVY